MKPIKTIDDYIAVFPENVQEILQKIRETIQAAAPEAEEVISYQMPTFKLNGNLVHFAAFKNHIGFYPVPSSIEKFKKELSRYKGAKGSVQFPLDKPMPLTLIDKIVKFRVRENLASAKVKTAKVKPTKKMIAKPKQQESGFPKIGASATRALHNAGYKRLEQLTKVSQAELAKLHGIGPKALGILKEALKAKGLNFKS